jgi:dTMP kinase
VTGRGPFVVFEGIDASGKSTHARRVAGQRHARFAFEPGDTDLGAGLRRWLLDARSPMSPETEALLMLADRSHHVHTVLEPTLAAGAAVVADRFYASTLAYQGYGRGVDLALLRAATDLAVGTCWPDLTVLLDVSLEVANERRARDHLDRFESADLAFHERVRQGYLEMASLGGAHWVVVDASGDEARVAAEVDSALAALPWPRA